MDEQSFIIWDWQETGLIDAFEIFSGLIIYSKTGYKEKLKFLFELFDLNEETFLNITELEFALNTTLTSVFKIWNIPIEDIDEDGSGEIEYDEFRNLLSSSD